MLDLVDAIYKPVISTKEIKLFDYQQDIISQLHDAFTRHTAVMCQMPTGTGKTVVLSSFIKDIDGEVWIIAHRRELVEQIKLHIERIIGGDERIKVMSIQWLSKNYDKMESRPAFIIIDEAHHSLADTYQELWQRYPTTKKLGMTATPCRLNGASFTSLYTKLITSYSIRAFINKGYLSAFDYASIRPNSEERRLIESLRKKGADGDYQQKEMGEVLNIRPNIERLYQSIVDWADGKKGIVYAINIQHARDIAAYYREQGLRAVAIDAKTPAMERHALVEDFRNNQLDVLVNVDIFSEGFDCPDVEYIQLARPTLSFSKYLQMVGRGLRVTKGKDACIIIDNVGMYMRFGLPTININWLNYFTGHKYKARDFEALKVVYNQWGVREETYDDTGCLDLIITHDEILNTPENRDIITRRRSIHTARKKHGTNVDDKCKTNITWRIDSEGDGIGVVLYKNDKRFYPHRFFHVIAAGYNCALAVNMSNKLLVIHSDKATEIEGYGKTRDFENLGQDILKVRFPDRVDSSNIYLDLHMAKTYPEYPKLTSLQNGQLVSVTCHGKTTVYTRTREYFCWEGKESDINADIENRSFYSLIQPNSKIALNSKIQALVTTVSLVLLRDNIATTYLLIEQLTENSIIIADVKGQIFRARKGKGIKSMNLSTEKNTIKEILQSIANIKQQQEYFLDTMGETNKHSLNIGLAKLKI